MNELLLFVSALVSAAFVIAAWKLGRERLYMVITVFLILISSVGGKIVLFFGHATNTGNIFYASVFLATYFLIERYGRREGLYSIWVGVVAVVFFSILARLTALLVGTEMTATLNDAVAIAFSPLPRLALASLAAYAVSQTINVHLYIYLKKKMEGRRLWLRANLSNVAAQLVDSVIFFTIAFWGVVSFDSVSGIIVTGLVIKIVYMMLASPLLYLNAFEQDEDAEGNTVFQVRLPKSRLF